MKFLKIAISLILLFLICSCKDSQIAKNFHKLDLITDEKRTELLEKLYMHISQVASLPSGETIIKQDLLRLEISDKQFDNCPVGPMYLFLKKANISNYNYEKLIDEKIAKADSLNLEKSKIYDMISKNSDDKVVAINRIIDELDINNKYGDLAEITNLTFKYNDISLKDPFKNIAPQYMEGEQNPLLNKIIIMDFISNLAQKLPIMNPMPKAKIIRHFGSRLNPVTMKLEDNLGMNFRALDKSQIFATAKGKVIVSDLFEDLGYSVVIDHGNNIKTIYSQLEFPPFVKKGDEVEIMQAIGKIQATESSAGNYFHYEIRINDRPVDPRIFLRAGRHCNYG